jgi:arylsulfatase A-like enzyme
LAFVERNKDRPFFLYLAYTIPHAKMEIPSDAPYSNEDWPQAMKNHAAMITRMDRDIGLLLDKLEEFGIDEKTLVLFTSDNGPHSEGGAKSSFFDSNGPLRGMKRDLYEGGIREPTIARWPGKVPAGNISDHVWAMWDILPTYAELAGAKSPKNIDGMSQVRALMGKEQKTHAFFYWEFHEGGGMSQAVRVGDWKAVLKVNKPMELYNLEDDLGEENNIVGQHPEVVAKIMDYLKTARTESKYWPAK